MPFRRARPRREHDPHPAWTPPTPRSATPPTQPVSITQDSGAYAFDWCGCTDGSTSSKHGFTYIEVPTYSSGAPNTRPPSISPPTPAAPARTSAGTRPQPTPPTARSSNSSSPPSNANSPTGGIWTASTSTSPMNPCPPTSPTTAPLTGRSRTFSRAGTSSTRSAISSSATTISSDPGRRH